MKILITGINGFIGRRVGQFLAARHDVFGISRAPTSLRPLTGVIQISADLSDPAFIDCLPSDIDCVIHLAQSTQYRTFPEGADDMRRINIDATCQLLDWARTIGVKQFIFSSTANVYGTTTERLTEAHSTQPESFYGATKLAAEHLAKQYQCFYQVDVLRLFTVYGPGQKGMLIPNIADRIKQGLPITLAEGVGLYLTPVYVEDVVLIIEKLLEDRQNGSFRLFNVCGNEVTNLGEIVRALERTMNLRACIQLTDAKAQNFSGSNSHLIKYIGDIILNDIETGLAISFDGANSTCS